MPTDRERRYTMWRCTNDRERGCRKLMGLITVEKVKLVKENGKDSILNNLDNFDVYF